MVLTGCEQLDKMLGGGIPSGAMSAIFGQWKIGKTLLVLQIACKYSIESKRKVLYLDTEAFFNSKDVQDIYLNFFNKRFGGEAQIDFEFVADAFDFAAMFGREIKLEYKKAKAGSEGKMEMIIALKNRPRNMPLYSKCRKEEYGMIIIDSFSNPIETLLTSGRRQDFPARANLVKSILGSLMVLAADLNVAVLQTTHESKDPTNMYDTGKPVLGSPYGYGMKTIFQLRYSKGKDHRKTTLFRAPGIMESKTEPVILEIKQDIGFVDVKTVD